MTKKKILTVMAALAVVATILGGCTNNKSSKAANGSEKTVTLSLYLYGSEGVANPDILKALNEKLKQKVNATLEVKYIDWGDIRTKYPLLWTSGENFDMAYVASNAPVPYATLAKQNALADITNLLDKSAPTLKTALNADAWKSMLVNGHIYGVPSTYSEFTAHGFVSRTDLMKKYNIGTIASIGDMEKYMDAAKADGWIPLNGNYTLASDMYHLLIDTTSDWIDAPGLPNTDLYFVGRVSNPNDIFVPAFTDEFEAFIVKMHEWAVKGYWSTDVLSSSQDDKDNFNNGLSASFITHQPDWTGNYGILASKLPGVTTEFYCFPEANGKIIRKMGCENATGISAMSKYPEKSLQVIEKLMTDEECYRLFQYGIEGREYVIKDNTAVQPDTYDAKKDAGGFAGWAFRTDALNIPYASEDPRRYTLNAKWKKTAIDNPYVGFSFDSTNVSAELSAIANVDSQLGTQLMLGKTTEDPHKALKKYREQLKVAGIDTVLAEVKKQYAEWKNRK